MDYVSIACFMLASFVTGWIACKDYFNLWEGGDDA